MKNASQTANHWNKLLPMRSMRIKHSTQKAIRNSIIMDKKMNTMEN
jgi:hypothetical protein